MHIQFSTFMPEFTINNKKHKTPAKQNFVLQSSLSNDIFVKNHNVSFKAKETGKSGGHNIFYDFATLGIAGAPFVFAIAATKYLSEKSNPEDIFLPDGSYLMNTNEFKLESDKITADGDDGIFKIKGTGIDIDASKYDIADIENGIYKNYDGSVDIDLMNNKYIDAANGIFIDPASKVSAIEANGELVNIQLPSFGSGYPTCPWDPRANDSSLISSSEQTEETLLPYKNLMGRMRDFFSGNSKEKHDIFGRKFFEFTDKEGHMQKIALDDETAQIVDKFHIKGNEVPELAKFIDNLKLEQYITNNHSDYESFLPTEIPSIEDFIANLSSIKHNSDVDLADAITDITDEDIDITDDESSISGEILKGFFSDED